MTEASHRPGLRVAVLGHAGHGKSALATALTERVASRSGVAPYAYVERLRPDRPWPWNGAHGTFALDGVERLYSGVDVVAARRLVGHAASVVASVDACVLVVSAVEGVMTQTHEHARLARHLTGGGVVVFLNHCDQVTDPEQLDLAEMETRQALYDAGFEGDAVTVVRGAARPPETERAAWEPALDATLAALDHSLRDAVHDDQLPLWATVLRRWGKPSHFGPVVEVSVRQGTLPTNARVRVSGRAGYAHGALVRELRRFDRVVPRLEAGQIGTAALSLDPPEVGWRFPRTGDALHDPEVALAPSPLRVRLRLIDAAHGGRRTPIVDGHRAVAWLWGRRLVCTVRLPSPMAPGEERSDALLVPVEPTLASAGATFVLRDGSGWPPSSRHFGWSGLVAVGEVR